MRILCTGTKLLIGLTWAMMLLLAGLSVYESLAGETLTLTKPVTFPSITGYTVERLTFDWPGASILAQVRGPNGEAASCAWTGATATTTMRVA